MRKKLCLLLTTTMLTTCLGTAVAAPADGDTTLPPAQAAVTTTVDQGGDKTPAAELTDATPAAETTTETEAPASATAEPAPAAEPTAISVKVDGQALTLDQPPVIQDGRTLVPLRAIFEALGAWVVWDADAQSVIAEKHFDNISLVIGDNKLSINGAEKTLDVPAQIIDGRTMVPVRAISEAFGAKVEWNAVLNTVSVESVQTGAHAIADKYLSTTGKTADGSKTLYTVTAAYPVLANPDNSSIITTINTAMKKLAEDYLVQSQKTFAELEADPAVIPVPYTFDLRYEVTYDQDGLLSFCTKAMEYTGGAHPNSIMTGKTFDTTLGKELALTDILKGTQEEINQQIIASFTAQIDKNPEQYFEEAKDTLAKDIEQAGFYLSKDGVVVYFPLYTLQPYAAGFSTCTLPFEKAAK